MSKKKQRKKRHELKPISLNPLTPDKALADVFKIDNISRATAAQLMQLKGALEVAEALQ